MCEKDRLIIQQWEDSWHNETAAYKANPDSWSNQGDWQGQYQGTKGQQSSSRGISGAAKVLISLIVLVIIIAIAGVAYLLLNKSDKDDHAFEGPQLTPVLETESGQQQTTKADPPRETVTQRETVTRQAEDSKSTPNRQQDSGTRDSSSPVSGLSSAGWNNVPDAQCSSDEHAVWAGRDNAGNYAVICQVDNSNAWNYHSYVNGGALTRPALPSRRAEFEVDANPHTIIAYDNRLTVEDAYGDEVRSYPMEVYVAN